MIQLHPRSLVLGLAIGACALFAMAQSAPQYASTVRVQYMPHPRDMVQIEEGTPYTVPVGKVFVLTGLGIGNGYAGNLCALKVNGTNEIVYGGSQSNQPPTPTVSIQFVPPGFTAQAGDVVDVGPTGTGGGGRAWGYLADQ